jgi:hypothetical protein
LIDYDAADADATGDDAIRQLNTTSTAHETMVTKPMTWICHPRANNNGVFYVDRDTDGTARFTKQGHFNLYLVNAVTTNGTVPANFTLGTLRISFRIRLKHRQYHFSTRLPTSMGTQIYGLDAVTLPGGTAYTNGAFNSLVDLEFSGSQGAANINGSVAKVNFIDPGSYLVCYDINAKIAGTTLLGISLTPTVSGGAAFILDQLGSQYNGFGLSTFSSTTAIVSNNTSSWAAVTVSSIPAAVIFTFTSTNANATYTVAASGSQLQCLVARISNLGTKKDQTKKHDGVLDTKFSTPTGQHSSYDAVSAPYEKEWKDYADNKQSYLEWKRLCVARPPMDYDDEVVDAPPVSLAAPAVPPTRVAPTMVAAAVAAVAASGPMSVRAKSASRA